MRTSCDHPLPVQLRRHFLLALGLLSISVTALIASEATDSEMWPGARYDESIPTFDDILGHAPGEWIVSHPDALRYLRALESASAGRMKVFTTGETWERRELVYAVIGTKQRLDALDDLKARIARVADPRQTSADDARGLIAELPATVWLAYGVHGNEISSPDAALFFAYHLLAAQGDPSVDQILEETLVFVDPMQNPDGRTRFVHNFTANTGIEPDPARSNAVHDEPWPGGRTNHYLFDLNRDWLPLTQPETRARVASLREWLPLVFVDLHEMGGDSSYYFAPEAVPYNPHLAPEQRTNLDLFGRNNAKWFDRYGFDYFTREIFDAFYPGYGASWPAYYGAIAMTYEMASARGLAWQRSDGDILTFRDGVQRHFVSSVGTAEAAAMNREKLWSDFRLYRETAIEEGLSEVGGRLMAFPARGNKGATDRLASVVAEHGGEIYRLSEATEMCGSRLPAGSYIADLAQPAKRMLMSFLDNDVPMEEEFLREQERLRALGLPDQIYDVTSWSLPLMFGAEMIRCAGTVPAGAERLGNDGANTPRTVAGTLDRRDAKVAYLVRWGDSGAARFLARALANGLTAFSSDVPFTMNNENFPAGTLAWKVMDNPPDLVERLAVLAAETGVSVTATDTSWVQSGVNFGSNRMARLKDPAIAILWDAPTSSYSAGATRFLIERELGHPVTVIRVSALSRTDLDTVDVLIFPDSRGYEGAISGSTGKQLQAFVRGGGVTIGLGGGIAPLAEHGLLSTQRERRAGTDSEGPEKKGGELADGTLLTTEADYLNAIEPDGRTPDSLAGVLLRARTDQHHWLTAGLASHLNVLVRGGDIYTPLQLDAGRNAAIFEAPEELLVSGYAWQETLEQMAFKPFVMVEPLGTGLTIGITADPTVRAYQEGLLPLLASAIFRRSGSHAVVAPRRR